MVLEDFQRVVDGTVPIWDGAWDGPGWVELERMAPARSDFGVEVDRDIGVSD